MTKNFDTNEHIIFECIVGSKAYGTDTPDSDTDIKGVCIPPPRVLHSLFHKFEQKEDADQDRVIYSLAKFMSLAGKCNPTLLALLFVEEPLWITNTKYFTEIRSRRDLFLSSKYIKNSFSGYAISQLKRMKTHVRWMEKAPTKPEPEEFGVSHSLLIGRDEIGAYDWLEGDGVKFSHDVQDLMMRIKRYRHALHEWKNYEKWRDNRNEKRAKLELDHGYDTKHAYHLVRLARLGEELLKTGHMTISNRSDVQDFIDIRNGLWSYERLLEFAEGIDGRLSDLEEKSLLPKTPQFGKIEELYVDIIDWYNE